MKHEVMGSLREFYKLGTVQRSLNATFIVLVSKKKKVLKTRFQTNQFKE